MNDPQGRFEQMAPRLDLTTRYPFLRLARSHQMAIVPAKWLLGLATVLGLYVIGGIMDGLCGWACPHSVGPDGLTPFFSLVATLQDGWFSIVHSVFGLDVHGLWATLHMTAERCCDLFCGHWLYWIVFIPLALAWCSVTVGGLARLAAVHAARDENLPMAAGVGYAVDKAVHFFAAPLLPFVISLFCGVVLVVAAWVLGWLLSFIGIGYWLSALLMIFAFAGGLIGAGLLFFGVVTLPLSYPALAVEGTDCFDCFSRGVSYLVNRPWHALAGALMVLVHGAVCFAFVYLLFYLTLAFTHTFVTIGFPGRDGMDSMWRQPQLRDLHVPIPKSHDVELDLGDRDPRFVTDVETLQRIVAELRREQQARSLATTQPASALTTPAPAAAVSTDTVMEPVIEPRTYDQLGFWQYGGYLIMYLWLMLLLAGLGGYLISYMVCGFTQLYLLLRYYNDRTEFDDIYMDEYEDTEQTVPALQSGDVPPPPATPPSAS